MAGRTQKVWITRAQPGAGATAERVRARGHEPVVAPLLRIEGAPDVRFDLADVAALAFTSANGVQAFAAACEVRDLPAFAVGDATATAARAAGFRDVRSADGDVAALARLIVAEAPGGVVLHPTTAEPAGDLCGALRAAGLQARAVEVYRSAPVNPEELDLPALLACDVALLHSPKAGRALAEVLSRRPSPRLRALGLSAAVVAPLAHAPLAGCRYPAHPREPELLNLIDIAE